MKIIYLFCIGLFFLFSCSNEQTEIDTTDHKDSNFSIAFMTDIHLQRERHAQEGFLQAIKHVNQQDVDFVITGGDLIMDALGVGFGKADSLYLMYTGLLDSFSVPVYNTLGNHEVFGIYEKSGVEATHQDYGKKMFQRYFKHSSYYTIVENGWCFMFLDGIGIKPDGHHYYGDIDAKQMDWIKSVLDTLDKHTPIVITTHIPFVTVGTQLQYGSTLANDSAVVVSNSKEVVSLFNQHNLKLVLQGHLHFYENIEVNGVHYVTGGAVSARWWTGPNNGTEEGYVKIKLQSDSVEKIEYVDYGWEVEE